MAATTVWMATVTTILAGTSDPAPQARVNPFMITTAEKCETWKASSDAKPPAGPVDAVTGKSILAEYYTCVPLNADRIAKNIATAVEQGAE